jgi:thiosulfate reductase cytochrome b subunit
MEVIEKHSLWLRCVHWLNAPLLFLMVWSGILIYWANDIYPGFFPEKFYRFFHIDHRLAEGMAVHFSIAWLLILNGMIYLTYLAVSGHWRELFPDRQTFRQLIPTILHDLGLRKTAPPQGKFNAAQRVAYTGVILIAIIEILSGFSIYKPIQLRWLSALFGGYESARLVHFAGMLLLVSFFLLHVAQVIRAGWNNFRAMVAGFEVKSNDNKV